MLDLGGGTDIVLIEPILLILYAYLFQKNRPVCLTMYEIKRHYLYSFFLGLKNTCTKVHAITSFAPFDGIKTSHGLIHIFRYRQNMVF